MVNVAVQTPTAYLFLKLRPLGGVALEHGSICRALNILNILNALNVTLLYRGLRQLVVDLANALGRGTHSLSVITPDDVIGVLLNATVLNLLLGITNGRGSRHCLRLGLNTLDILSRLNTLSTLHRGHANVGSTRHLRRRYRGVLHRLTQPLHAAVVLLLDTRPVRIV